MNYLGINPQRDKLAKIAIYGTSAATMLAIKAAAIAFGVNPHTVTRASIATWNTRQKAKEKAWKKYSQTGSIQKALNVLFSNS